MLYFVDIYAGSKDDNSVQKEANREMEMKKEETTETPPSSLARILYKTLKRNLCANALSHITNLFHPSPYAYAHMGDSV